MTESKGTKKELLQEIGKLKLRLAEAADTLRAIREGEVDAILGSTSDGDRIYTLQGAEEPYRVFFDAMNEGAATTTLDGTILYCNLAFADLVKVPLEKVPGMSFLDFTPDDMRRSVLSFLAGAGPEQHALGISLRLPGRTNVPVSISATPLRTADLDAVCLVVTNLTEHVLANRLQQANTSLNDINAMLKVSREELQASEQTLRDSHKAALNLMEDALEARKDAEAASANLLHEIAQRKKIEEALRKLNEELELRVAQRTRFYNVLARSREAIVRQRDEKTLFKELCRIIVDTGGFQLAWIGMVDQETREVRPTASAGATGYLDGLRVIAADVPEGRGPTGRAVVEGRHIINLDFEQDENMLPWRERARTHALRSSSSFPLRNSGTIVGAVTIYSKLPSVFSDDEVVTLSSLAEDISFAIETMTNDAKRKQAEIRTVLINELLLLFTRESDRRAFLDAAIELIRRWSGCRHVGIRVTDERGNIPYESCVGFGDEFLRSERTLSLDHDHCACTRVVRGMPEPQDLPAVTAAGSFFSNNSERFMEGLTEEQRTRFRGVCVRSGFLSLAVVPIRYRNKVLGVMHVADEHEGMVPLPSVELLEQVALIIGEALFRFSVERESSRLAAAVESAADAVVVTESEQGTILYVNDAFELMTGYSRSEAVGKDIHLLDSGRHDAAFYDALRSVLRRDGAWQGQLVNMKKDGTLYFEDCTISPVRDHAGQILNYVSVRRDITEKIRLESIAESVSMMDNLGSIFAGVRHEIGNPINNAKIHLSVLQQKMNTMPADRVREYVDRTLAEIGRVEHLLHTLKTFNLFETPVLEDLETGPLLELFRGLVREDLEVKGITLSTQILPGAESVRANARALQHVLLNLVTNAADALKDRPGPRIDIMFSREDDRVRIRISDNGAGMNASQLANLFKPFHTTKQHGTGLGLVIVKKMLTTIKGTIEIASHEGSGTAVTIYLPGGDAGQAHL